MSFFFKSTATHLVLFFLTNSSRQIHGAVLRRLTEQLVWGSYDLQRRRHVDGNWYYDVPMSAEVRVLVWCHTGPDVMWLVLMWCQEVLVWCQRSWRDVTQVLMWYHTGPDVMSRRSWCDVTGSDVVSQVLMWCYTDLIVMSQVVMCRHRSWCDVRYAGVSPFGMLREGGGVVVGDGDDVSDGDVDDV